jgi:dinuclear metal center YbgI/SA1388 family protein
MEKNPGKETELQLLTQFCDHLLGVEGFPDYGGAVNGLQVEGPARVRRVAAAVDAAEYSIQGAVDAGAQLLLVHHGLFWGGGAPLTGRLFRRIAPLIRNEVAVYSAHLPLDAHPEVGNCAQLLRALDLEPGERFGSYEEHAIGFRVEVDEGREAFRSRVADVLGGPVQLLPGGPERIGTLGVVTGGGGSFLAEAAAEGVETLLTGEGAHHTFVDAMELGLNVLLGGHYRTETWGVQALARRLEEEFGVEWVFLDYPSGL